MSDAFPAHEQPLPPSSAPAAPSTTPGTTPCCPPQPQCEAAPHDAAAVPSQDAVPVSRRKRPPHVPTTPQQASRRLLNTSRVIMVLITLAMLGMLARVAQLQTAPPQQIAKLVDSQNSAVTLLPRRGSIVDRHGRPLSGTHLVKRLFIDPQLVQNPAAFARHVASELQYDPASIQHAIETRPTSRFVVIDQDLSTQRDSQLQFLRLPALGVQQHPVRQYPMGHLAGQVLGFVGVDQQGLDGLEQQLNSKLTGKNGSLGYWRDARRKPIWVDEDQYQPPVDGQTVRLTLDSVIQNIAETELQATVQKFNAESGQIIVMHPQTGHILAMANYPFFDPSDYKDAKPDLRRNRCITDPFEPGSTFKPFIWAAATEMNLAKLDEIVDTTTSGVYVLPYGRRLRDASPHGEISWEKVLITSSNIGMAKIAMRMTPQQLHNACDAYGFGRTTGSRLPGEGSGVLHPLNKWTKYSMSSIPMGHEISVTPLQLARAFSALANDGLMVTPRIVIHADDTQTPINVRILSSKTAQTTKQVMRKVITEGTGRRANSKHYSLFGKTGTAEVHVPGQGGYKSSVYVSNFIAAAPLDNPQVVVLCVIHKPDPKIGHFGGTVAGPTVQSVVEQTLAYLGVAPDLAPLPAKPQDTRRLAQRN